MPQFTDSYPNRRNEHIWHHRRDGSFKCVLCGAITTSPGVVEHKGLAPERYEKLTDEERDLAPVEPMTVRR